MMISNSFYSVFGFVVCCALVTKQIIGSTQLSYTVARESTLAGVVPDSIIIQKTRNNNVTNNNTAPDSSIILNNKTQNTNATKNVNKTRLWESSSILPKTNNAAIVPDSIIQNNKTQNKNATTNATTRLWEASSILPKWMKEYFDWHQDQLANHLHHDNWQSHRYLVIRCLESEICGGASDRLSSIPKYIRVASKSKRLLFIKWTRPAPLEEFLVPPVGGMNWSIPEWLDDLLDYHLGHRMTGKNSTLPHSNTRLVIARDQSHDHGMHYYNQERESNNEAEFDYVFRDIWNVLFTPAPAVQAIIDHNMKDLNLIPGQYIAVHVRSRYKSDHSNNHEMIGNSINCAMILKKELEWPIYFASDSINATINAVQYVNNNKQRIQNNNNASSSSSSSPVVRLVFHKTDSEPLHLDRGNEFLERSNGWRNNTASDFYSVFVDLYLLANSGCLTYGVGGFGKWGSLLSYNSSCHIQHSRRTCPSSWNTTNNDTTATAVA